MLSLNVTYCVLQIVKRSKNTSVMASVPEFYSGKSVFISGGSGFVGKVLIYKLLNNCPDVKAIYLLMRQKKGLSCEERLNDLFSHQVFDTLREASPDFTKKLRLVAGDITEDGLGISDEDRQELQNECNIIFHSAACVRFDQKLKDAVNMNVKGTLKMLTLAESMKKLEVFVHLSTAYCRCYLPVLEEKLYPAVHNPRHIMRMVDWMDDDLLAYVETQLIKSEPNTYSYTKAITEDLVAEYGDKFPTAIARPSIVIASWKEPVPGWIDNMQGPTGLIIGSGKGVIRSMHCEPSYTADAMSVDVIVNACILIAYTTALKKPKSTQVYNLTLSGMIRMTWGEIIKVGRKLCNQYPYTIALWYPGGTLKSYRITHQISVFFYHLVPAYVVDALLFLARRKTFMVRLQKRITNGLILLQYYTTKEWHFANHNFKSLKQNLSAKDREDFYTDISSVNTEDYLKSFILGIREYVCKEDPSNLPRAKKLNRMLYIADRTVKLAFYLLLAGLLYTFAGVFTAWLGLFDQALKTLLPS